MKKSLRTSLPVNSTKKETRHSTEAMNTRTHDDPYIKCVRSSTSTNYHRSGTEEKVRIESCEKRLSKKGDDRERNPLRHKKKNEQERTHGTTEGKDEKNGEQKCRVVRSCQTQGGRCEERIGDASTSAERARGFHWSESTVRRYALHRSMVKRHERFYLICCQCFLCPCNRPLSRCSCSAKVWSNTWLKHTTRKNKPSLVSAPIFRVTHQSTVKCHHFENCNLYKDLYGERVRLARSAHLPYKTL